jgi:outer membrane protein OmpA-like peptidoglycan-associated protein
MRKSLVAVSLLALTVAVAPACATKKFVRTEVGGVNQKVDTLTGTVEETQERTRQNAERIGVVDQKAESAGKAAAGAQSTADAAQRSATDAGNRATEANKTAMAVGGRLDEVVASSRRLIYEVTLSEDQGKFLFNKKELPDEAKARLDELIAQLKADPKGIYIEVEGHTDNVGDPSYNEKLGMERAEAVKRYLYEQHQVPLHKINVISYGESKPVAPNKTKDGRAQNRRVVVRILS